MSRFRFLSCLLVALLLLSSTGCSIFVGGMQELTIITTESNADIYINGELRGRGKTTMDLPRDRGVSIVVKAPGFETVTKDVNYTLSNTGLADLAGAFICIVPGIGLLTPGAQELVMDTVMIPLEPVGAETETEDAVEE